MIRGYSAVGAGGAVGESGAPGGGATGGGGLRRRTPLSVRGEPMIWLTGGALVVCLLMIVGLVGMIVARGVTTFWPRPIDRVTLTSGELFLGVPTDEQESPAQVLYRTGNRDIGRESFRWVDRADIASVERPEGAVMVEREAWSVWLGTPERLIEISASGTPEVVAEGYEAVMAAFEERHPTARRRRAEIEELKKDGLGAIHKRMEAGRLRTRQAEIRLARAGEARGAAPWGLWCLTGVGVAGLVATGVRLGRLGDGHSVRGRWSRVGRITALAVAGVGLMAMLIYAPWRAGAMTPERLGEVRERASAREAVLQAEYEEVLGRVRELEAADAGVRLVVVEPTEGRMAPERQIKPDSPMMLSQVVRMVDANAMGWTDKLGVFFFRWWEYLSTAPREANTEGGVYPVIVGTVVLTLLLTVTVTPLGVIAALYLREYARQGIFTSIIRISVNNLAGVPSIVYGVFGLGFFCYTVGRYVDAGPSPEARLAPGWWWAWCGLGVCVLIGAYACGVWASPAPGTAPGPLQRALRRFGWLAWAAAAGVTVVLVVRTPFFGGFFEARAVDGSPTFGARGMLWASLTLALLTLPVVIVATEEAIASVPNSMREGSFGCGASRWQTLRRIVLPGAMPGILTGAILAMARGAGEVAPLMLVGAVKLNQDLPVSSEPPFLHLDRSFMHLGFHIYDLGFQSPDSQAARPLVWTTTLLLLAIVLTLNLIAIVIRARLRARLGGPSV